MGKPISHPEAYSRGIRAVKATIILKQTQERIEIGHGSSLGRLKGGLGRVTIRLEAYLRGDCGCLGRDHPVVYSWEDKDYLVCQTNSKEREGE